MRITKDNAECYIGQKAMVLWAEAENPAEDRYVVTIKRLAFHAASKRYELFVDEDGYEYGLTGFQDGWFETKARPGYAEKVWLVDLKAWNKAREAWNQED